MSNKACPACGGDMKRNGRTKAGTQRWRCKACNDSTVHTIDAEARELEAFLRRLLSKGSQPDMPGGGRTFRRRASRFWEIWPLPEPTGEVHRVVYVDGIYLARDLVILIARSERFVLSWYMARSETSRAWVALLKDIPAPDVVVSDGAKGLPKALGQVWPGTKVQRCVSHAFGQVRRCTTASPKLQAGVELYGLAKDLMRIEDLRQARWWVERFMQWCDFWNDFLEQRTVVDGRREYTHERLRKARRGLAVLVNQGTLFTYLDPTLTGEGPLPSTNNRIEGGTNAQLRAVLRNHRGLSLERRVKAVYWHCYMHTECPRPAAEMLRSMPTNADIDLLYELYAAKAKKGEGPSEWGEGITWSEFHQSTAYPYSTE